MPGSEGITGDLVRIRLFFISYVPLWLMLAFRAAPPGTRWHWFWGGRTALCTAFAVLVVWGIADALRLIRGSRRTGARRLVFDEISDQGGNAAGYLATYLLPFIGLVPADWGDWAAYGAYFLVAGLVFIRTDLTFVNPTLYVLRYRVVSANAYLPEGRQPVPGSPFVVICRDPRMLTSPVDVTSVGGGYIVKRAPRAAGGQAEAPPGSGGVHGAGGMGRD